MHAQSIYTKPENLNSKPSTPENGLTVPAYLDSELPWLLSRRHADDPRPGASSLQIADCMFGGGDFKVLRVLGLGLC